MYMKPAIAGSTLAPEGMHVLYADRSEEYKVTYIKDVPYCERDGKTLTMQMLYPEVPAGMMPGAPFADDSLKMPLVVYVQGSAWMKQNCYMNLPNLVDLARAGFVVASVEYRPSLKHPGLHSLPM